MLLNAVLAQPDCMDEQKGCAGSDSERNARQRRSMRSVELSATGPYFEVYRRSGHDIRGGRYIDYWRNTREYGRSLLAWLMTLVPDSQPGVRRWQPSIVTGVVGRR